MKFKNTPVEVVDLKTMNHIKDILCYHLQSHSIKATEKMETFCDDGDEYDAMMQRRFWHDKYVCRMSCDRCGWKLSVQYLDPLNKEKIWFELARAFEKQIPADCKEAKDLRIIKDVLEC